MKRNDVLKHLDRAFTQAPPDLSASVEAAFERGEKAVKQRHKIFTAVSVAAALAVLCAAIALAAGTLARPRRDNVVAAPGKAGGPRMYTPEPEATAPAEIYYATLQGVYYHSDEHCSGMMNAEPISEAAALAEGKRPCPVCVGAEGTAEAATAGQEYALSAAEAMMRAGVVRDQLLEDPLWPEVTIIPYYATVDGTCFHTDEHCGGMHNAYPISWDVAWISGKWPCPTCVNEAEVPHLWFYCTDWGKYFHIYADCSGMKNAKRGYPASFRGNKTKTACPECIPEGGFALCWATTEGKYYHSERECMAMQGARITTEMYSAAHGKTPCPVCWKRGKISM